VASCVFCKIAAGQLPAHFVLDEADRLAFLDTRPIFKGHVLVLPRRHVETYTELPAEEVGGLFEAGQRVARAVERGLAADGTFVAINNKVSQSVPHLHVHVVPRRWKDGLRGFFWPRTTYASEDEAQEVAATIRASL